MQHKHVLQQQHDDDITIIDNMRLQTEQRHCGPGSRPQKPLLDLSPKIKVRLEKVYLVKQIAIYCMLHSWVCCAATENQDAHECQAITRGEINCRRGPDNNFLLMVWPNTIQ